MAETYTLPPTCTRPDCGHPVNWHAHGAGRCYPPHETKVTDGGYEMLLDPVAECSCPAYKEASDA